MANDKTAEELAKENERLRKEVSSFKAKEAQSGWGKTRRVLTPIVGVLTVLVLVATTIGVWVNRTVWNEDKYIERVVPVASDPAVIDALATQLTDQAMVALDVQTRVHDAVASLASQMELPEQIAFLAGPLTESIHGLIHDQAVKLLSSDQFQAFWEELNARLHPKLVALLRGDYSQLPNVQVGEEVVQIDLIPVLTQMLRDLVQQGVEGLDLNVTIPEVSGDDARTAIAKLSTALGVQLPEDFGQITIMTTAELRSYQATANLLRATGWILLFLSLVLITLTLVLAHDRRRAVVWLGLGTTAGIIVATVILRNVKEAILGSIDSKQAQDAASAVFTQFGSSLKAAGALVAWTALVIAVVAYLLGRPPWMRKLLAWSRGASDGKVSDLEALVAEHADGVRAVGIGLAVLVLFWAGINWASVVIVGALLVAMLLFVARSQNESAAAN